MGEIVYKLNDIWLFKYKPKTNYSKNQSKNNWLSNFLIINEIDSIKSFWSTFNNVLKISSVQPGTIYSIFKDNIEPCWEHPKNINGFSFYIYLYPVMKSNKNKNVKKNINTKINNIYIRSIVHLVSNEKDTHKYINGLTIDRKTCCYKLTWWINLNLEKPDKNISIKDELIKDIIESIEYSKILDCDFITSKYNYILNKQNN